MTNLDKLKRLKKREMDEFLSRYAWFRYGKTFIHSNISAMYESNIGEFVVKLDCPSDWTIDQVKEKYETNNIS